jgi:hypothetical protein
VDPPKAETRDLYPALHRHPERSEGSPGDSSLKTVYFI